MAMLSRAMMDHQLADVPSSSRRQHRDKSMQLAVQPEAIYTAEVNVVDYEEEIIRLYNEFLGKLVDYSIIIKDEMTAREIQSLVLRTEGFDADALDKLTTCFEKAEYSCHLVDREDYEIMYLSLKEFDINFE